MIPCWFLQSQFYLSFSLYFWIPEEPETAPELETF